MIELDYPSCESFRLTENRWLAVRDPACRHCGILMQSVAEIASIST